MYNSYNMKRGGVVSKKLRRFIKFLAVTVGLIIIAFSIKDIIPLLKVIISTSRTSEGMVDYINKFGYEGIFLLFTLNVIPQLLVFIPQVPVTILTGLCYGTVLGSVICLLGQAFGIGLLLIILRNLKTPVSKLINNFSKKDKFKKTRSLSKIIKKLPKRTGYLIIICFYLIPGLPSTITPFLFAWSDYSILSFLTCMMIGSTPATLMYSYSGELVQVRNWKLLVIIIIIIVIFSITLYLNRNKIMNVLLKDEEDSD